MSAQTDRLATLIDVHVPGKPRPQGSMTLWRAPDGSDRAKYAPEVVAHRNLVVGALRNAWAGRGRMDGAASVMLTFTFARPKSHYGTGRNAAKVLPSAPDQHTQHPDLDKLTRLVFDALTVAQVWADDAQGHVLVASKEWGPQSQTRIQLWRAL